MSETLGYTIDYEDALTPIASEISKRYGLDQDIADIGTEWARDWWYGVSGLAVEDFTAQNICDIRDQALDGLPVPRDATEGRPTFRVRFAAQEALYEIAGDTGSQLRELLEGKEARIVPDFHKVDHVYTTLLDSYARRLYPFNQDSTRVPQDPRHMPRNLEMNVDECSEEQKIQLASFWFADCYYMRGINNSNDMTINLADLHEDYPEIFNLQHAMTLDPKYIEGLLLEYHLPVQHKQISKAWVENARRIVELYDGDPRKIFENFGTYENLIKRIANDHRGGGFIGFQKKMGSMLGYYYMSLRLVPYQNIPLPVDFHVLRNALSQGLIRYENLDEKSIPFEKTTDFLREVTFDFADHHDISQLALCDVIWLYSRAACVNSPTNSQKVVGKRQGRQTVWEPALTNAADASQKQLEAYQNSCGVCRLEPTCEHNVPSGRYYVSGQIHWPDPKLKLSTPQDDLHSIDTLQDAQKPVLAPNEEHAIDLRDKYRKEIEAKRVSLIRRLAQASFISLSSEDEERILAAIVESNGNTATSLSGKKFGFSDAEITLALGENPDPDELLAIRPYRAQPTTE